MYTCPAHRLPQDRVLKYRYCSLDDMQADFLLLCDNARTYNMEGSQICADANVIEVRGGGGEWR